MSIIIEIADIPPSNNQYLGRTNRFEYRDTKLYWEGIISACTRNMRIPEPYQKAVVHIHYTFPDRRRRDPDNFSGKFIMDPLVKFGFIQDDNFDVIHLELSAEYKKGVRKTTITITEVEYG